MYLGVLPASLCVVFLRLALAGAHVEPRSLRLLSRAQKPIRKIGPRRELGLETSLGTAMADLGGLPTWVKPAAVAFAAGVTAGIALTRLRASPASASSCCETTSTAVSRAQRNKDVVRGTYAATAGGATLEAVRLLTHNHATSPTPAGAIRWHTWLYAFHTPP